MHSAIKSQRMRNYAEQRITEYKRNLEAILAKDPKVQEYKQKQKTTTTRSYSRSYK